MATYRSIKNAKYVGGVGMGTKSTVNSAKKTATPRVSTSSVGSKTLAPKKSSSTITAAPRTTSVGSKTLAPKKTSTVTATPRVTSSFGTKTVAPKAKAIVKPSASKKIYK